MNRLLGLYAAALVMATGAAMAQSTSSQTTTTVTPSFAAPPAGVLSESRSEKTVGPDGTQTNSSESTYRNGNGVSHDSVTRTITVPPASVTTTRKSSMSAPE